MLDLPDVTLLTVSTIYHELTRLALEDCLRHVRFGGDVIRWSDVPINLSRSKHPTYYKAPLKNSAAYNNFLLKHAWKLVETTHFLVVQWDSWVTNPEMWDSAFLEYDYIGAPWPTADGFVVGNGGFSLRSRALAEYVSTLDTMEAFNEDQVICKVHRAELEEYGFRFAPVELAKQFSFECTRPAKTFGFHAFRNWPFVLRGKALHDRLDLCDEHAFKARQLEFFGINICQSTQLSAAL